MVIVRNLSKASECRTLCSLSTVPEMSLQQRKEEDAMVKHPERDLMKYLFVIVLCVIVLSLL